ncbi:MAG: hypothetical protein ACSLFB_11090 [Acidimicrobiales bacterium]
MSILKSLSDRTNSRALQNGQAGSTLITVMMMGVTLSLVSTVLLTNTVFNVERSAKSVETGGALQAAEAGINDYLAKLSDDRTYWSHWVHEAETTRTGGAMGTDRSWTDDATPGWGYATTKDSWKTLGNDYEYNIQVTPPAGAVTTVAIVATGRRVDATTGLKAVEAVVSVATLGDFLMVVDDDLNLDHASLATVGKVYLTDAPTGTYDLCHDGTANGNAYTTGNLYAEDRFVTGCGTHTGTGVAYDGDAATTYANLRTEVPTAITFASLLTPLDQITVAASAPGGIYRTNTSGSSSCARSWDVTFNSNGTVTIVKKWWNSWPCWSGSSSTETIAMPTTGAMWFDKKVTVLASTVDGRVSLRSAEGITIAGNIAYEAPGDDVLGLVAETNFTLSGSRTVRAALISRTGSFNDTSSSDNIAFTGMMALKDGGGTIFNQAGSFTWDSNLATLPPPFFPSIGETEYKVKTIREVNPRL